MTVKKISEHKHNAHATSTPQIKPQSIAIQRTTKKPIESLSSAGTSNRIVTTKPAFLAQINGQQVLLIPGPTPANGPVPVTFQTLKKAPAGATVDFQTLKDHPTKTEGFKIVKKSSSSTTVTVQGLNSCPPATDKTKQTPPVTFHALKNPPKAPVKKRTATKHTKAPVSIQPINSIAPVTPGKTQSKLEQCLRYGSAAVAQQGSSGSSEKTPAKNLPSANQVSSTIIKGPVILRLPNSNPGGGQVQFVRRTDAQDHNQTPTKNEVTIELKAVPEQAVSNNIQTSLYIQNNEQTPSQEFIFTNEMEVQSQFELDQYSDYLVPEMVCEEEVVSCGTEQEVDSCCIEPDIVSCYSEEVVSCESQTNDFVAPYSAEISVRIQSSSPPSNPMIRHPDPFQNNQQQQQVYDPKWSPAVKHHRDRILCDLLGIK